MSSTSSKRQAVATATVLNLGDTLMIIVQYTSAAKDVLASLAALPTSARTPTLAALHKLLRDPMAAMMKLWPVLQLQDLTATGAALALDAMQAFTAVAARRVITGSNRPNLLPRLHLWHNKITTYTSVRSASVLPMGDLLRLCTNLTSVRVCCATDAVAVLDAVTTPAHHVSSLTLNSSGREAEFAPALVRWLGSGHARDLAYVCSRASDATLFFEALRTPTTLSSLHLTFLGFGLVAPFVAVAPSFTRLTSLRISCHSPSNSLAAFALPTHFDAAPLRSLRVEGFYSDLPAMLNLLPTFPGLEELTLKCFYTLNTVVVSKLPSTRHRVSFVDVKFSELLWRTLAKNLLGTCVLDEMAWTSCALSASQATAMAPALREWITRGIRKISFVDCAFQEDHARALAAAIARTTSRVGVRIRIEDKIQRMKNANNVLLGQALASCRGVSIELPPVLGNNWRDELGAIDNLGFDHLTIDGRPRLVLASVA